jgi:hypothetical protein
MGSNAQGRIGNEAGGRMAVQLADSYRTAFAASDPRATAGVE